jgi:hypothetical protein
MNISININLQTLPRSQEKCYYTTIPSTLLQTIEEKSRQHLWQQTHQRKYKTLCNTLNRYVKEELDNFRIDSYKEILKDIHPGDNNLWSQTKRILNETPTTPPLLDNNKTAGTDQEKCEMLASHLENRFQHSKTIFPIVITIHQSGKPKNTPSSYWPISHLNSISKLLF